MEYNILNGIRTYAPSSQEELSRIAITNNKILIAVNAEKILNASIELKKLINRNLGYPDGVGAVWALKKKGLNQVVKIPGCELWLHIISSYYKEKSFYLVGGKEEIIQATVEKLRTQFPGINIVNYRNGYISSNKDKQELIQDISNKRPDVVFVAMGSPKQELLMEEMQDKHPALYQGLGGSFDVYTEKVQRAPKWWINNNLEWAYRLVKQPTRIKRQLVYINFFMKLKLNRL